MRLAISQCPLQLLQGNVPSPPEPLANINVKNLLLKMVTWRDGFWVSMSK